MNGKEFIKAVDTVEQEKGIDREIIFEAMENALMAAYKRNTGIQNSKVIIDKNTGDIKVYSYLTVVADNKGEAEDEDDIDLDYEISLTDARKIDKSLNIGDTIIFIPIIFDYYIYIKYNITIRSFYVNISFM